MENSKWLLDLYKSRLAMAEENDDCSVISATTKGSMSPSLITPNVQDGSSGLLQNEKLNFPALCPPNVSPVIPVLEESPVSNQPLGLTGMELLKRGLNDSDEGSTQSTPIATMPYQYHRGKAQPSPTNLSQQLSSSQTGHCEIGKPQESTTLMETDRSPACENLTSLKHALMNSCHTAGEKTLSPKLSISSSTSSQNKNKDIGVSSTPEWLKSITTTKTTGKSNSGERSHTSDASQISLELAEKQNLFQDVTSGAVTVARPLADEHSSKLSTPEVEKTSQSELSNTVISETQRTTSSVPLFSPKLSSREMPSQLTAWDNPDENCACSSTTRPPSVASAGQSSFNQTQGISQIISKTDVNDVPNRGREQLFAPVIVDDSSNCSVSSSLILKCDAGNIDSSLPLDSVAEFQTESRDIQAERLHEHKYKSQRPNRPKSNLNSMIIKCLGSSGSTCESGTCGSKNGNIKLNKGSGMAVAHQISGQTVQQRQEQPNYSGLKVTPSEHVIDSQPKISTWQSCKAIQQDSQSSSVTKEDLSLLTHKKEEESLNMLISLSDKLLHKLNRGFSHHADEQIVKFDGILSKLRKCQAREKEKLSSRKKGNGKGRDGQTRLARLQHRQSLLGSASLKLNALIERLGELRKNGVTESDNQLISSQPNQPHRDTLNPTDSVRRDPGMVLVKPQQEVAAENVMTTPASVHTMTTPASVHTMTTPASVHTMTTPASVHTMTTPASVHTMTTPASVHTMTTPASVHTMTTPASVHTMTTPASVHTMTTPASVHTMTTPASVHTMTTPASVHTMTTPASVHTMTTPASVHTMTTPASVHTMTTPASVHTMTTPASVHTMTTPASVHTMTTPASVHTMTTPASVHTMTTPASVHTMTTPASVHDIGNQASFQLCKKNKSMFCPPKQIFKNRSNTTSTDFSKSFRDVSQSSISSFVTDTQIIPGTPSDNSKKVAGTENASTQSVTCLPDNRRGQRKVDSESSNTNTENQNIQQTVTCNSRLAQQITSSTENFVNEPSIISSLKGTSNNLYGIGSNPSEGGNDLTFHENLTQSSCLAMSQNFEEDPSSQVNELTVNSKCVTEGKARLEKAQTIFVGDKVKYPENCLDSPSIPKYKKTDNVHLTCPKSTLSRDVSKTGVDTFKTNKSNTEGWELQQLSTMFTSSVGMFNAEVLTNSESQNFTLNTVASSIPCQQSLSETDRMAPNLINKIPNISKAQILDMNDETSTYSTSGLPQKDSTQIQIAAAVHVSYGNSSTTIHSKLGSTQSNSKPGHSLPTQPFQKDVTELGRDHVTADEMVQEVAEVQVSRQATPPPVSVKDSVNVMTTETYGTSSKLAPTSPCSTISSCLFAVPSCLKLGSCTSTQEKRPSLGPNHQVSAGKAVTASNWITNKRPVNHHQHIVTSSSSSLQHPPMFSSTSGFSLSRVPAVDTIENIQESNITQPTSQSQQGQQQLSHAIGLLESSGQSSDIVALQSEGARYRNVSVLVGQSTANKSSTLNRQIVETNKGSQQSRPTQTLYLTQVSSTSSLKATKGLKRSAISQTVSKKSPKAKGRKSKKATEEAAHQGHIGDYFPKLPASSAQDTETVTKCIATTTSGDTVQLPIPCKDTISVYNSRLLEINTGDTRKHNNKESTNYCLGNTSFSANDTPSQGISVPELPHPRLMMEFKMVHLIHDTELCAGGSAVEDFWCENFSDIRMTEEFWSSVDVW